MENEDEILSALQKGVVAAMQQSDDPALPVKYLLVGEMEGGQWTGIPNDQKWLELVWLPNNPTGDFWGQDTNHRGILRLILHWPNDGGGVYVPLRLFGSITRFFTVGKLLSGVQIYGKPTTTGMIEDGDDVLFPASIYYQSYRKGA